MRNSGRLALNHATLGPDVSFVQLLRIAPAQGFGAVGVWLDRLDGMAPQVAGARIRDEGLGISGVNRGGFFTDGEGTDLARAVDATRRRIDDTVALGAETLIIVPGGYALPAGDIRRARGAVQDGVAAVIDHAKAAGVRLAIEPFHPGLTSTLGVVNTLDLALDICDALGDEVGVVTDVFHIWWDPQVYRAIARAGERIYAHHLCDWMPGVVDARADRGLMGDGIGGAAQLTAAVLGTGFDGWLEVEVFSRSLWEMAPEEIADLCHVKAVSCMAEADRLNAEGRS